VRPWPWPCSSSRPCSGLGSGFLSCDISHHLAFGGVACSNKPAVKDGGPAADVDLFSQPLEVVAEVIGKRVGHRGKRSHKLRFLSMGLSRLAIRASN
jgi:hypothetical protein